MKKIVLTFVAAFALTASVFAQDKVVTETTVSTADLSTTVTHKLYNGDGNIILSFVEGVSQRVYLYDDFGNNIRQEYTDFVKSSQSRNYVYTFDDEGRVKTRQEFIGERALNTTSYEYDDHDNVISETGQIKFTYNNSYDTKGRLVKVTRPHPMDPTVEMSATVYTYNDDDLLIKTESFASGTATGYTSYVYDDSQNLTVQTSYDMEDNPISVTTYVYGEIDSYYAPTNVNAESNEGNTVTITWQGNANAIISNGKWIEVSGNSYTTEVLLDGEYSFYVSNNGNAVVTEPIDVFDTSKVGVSDVKLTGDIYYTFEVEKNSSDEDVIVPYYNFPISWSLPTGAEPLSYRIYYNENYSVVLEDGTARSFVVPARNTTLWSMSQGVFTLPFEIRVVAIYATGEMEPENVIRYTLEQTEQIIANDVKGVKAAAAPAEYFSLDGVRVPASNVKRGTFIIRQGNTVRKVQVK